jgi:hypothetical protein
MDPNDETSKLKSQLRDAYSMIEELKTNFHASFVDLQQKLQECVDEKERMQFKKCLIFLWIGVLISRRADLFCLTKGKANPRTT